MPKSPPRSIAMTDCSSSFEGLVTRISSPWIEACVFLKPPSLTALTIFFAASCGMPWVRLDGAAHRLAGALDQVADLEVLHRHAALDHPGLQHVEQRVHPELVVRREPDLRLGPVELDGAVGALEVVSLGDLLQGLVHGVVDLLEVGAGGDIEGGVAGHGRWWIGCGERRSEEKDYPGCAGHGASAEPA